MNDSVLVVAAPKDYKRIEASVQNIPITEKEQDVEETKEEDQSRKVVGRSELL